jgi:hypothetical protein
MKPSRHSFAGEIGKDFGGRRQGLQQESPALENPDATIIPQLPRDLMIGSETSWSRDSAFCPPNGWSSGTIPNILSVINGMVSRSWQDAVRMPDRPLRNDPITNLLIRCFEHGYLDARVFLPHGTHKPGNDLDRVTLQCSDVDLSDFESLK